VCNLSPLKAELVIVKLLAFIAPVDF